MVLFVNHHLSQRSVVQFWTSKLCMFFTFFTYFTRKNLELINCWLVFVSQKAEKEIVHAWLLQDRDELIIRKWVNYWVLERLDLVNWFGSSQELKTKDKGLLVIANFDFVNDHVIELAVSQFGCEPNFALSQD